MAADHELEPGFATRSSFPRRLGWVDGSYGPHPRVPVHDRLGVRGHVRSPPSDGDDREIQRRQGLRSINDIPESYRGQVSVWYGSKFRTQGQQGYQGRGRNHCAPISGLDPVLHYLSCKTVCLGDLQDRGDPMLDELHCVQKFAKCTISTNPSPQTIVDSAPAAPAFVPQVVSAPVLPDELPVSVDVYTGVNIPVADADEVATVETVADAVFPQSVGVAVTPAVPSLDSMLSPVPAAVLPTPPAKPSKCSRVSNKNAKPTRSSARLASKPKTNLTMEEQATALLMKRSGIISEQAIPDEQDHSSFRALFVNHLNGETVDSYRDLFSLGEDGSDPLAPLAAFSSLVSDHCPLVLSGNVQGRPYKGFRFESFWPKLAGFSVTVEDAWNKQLSIFNPFLRLHTKLQRTAKALRAWSKALIGNNKLLMTAAKLLIWILDVVQDYRPLSPAELSLHKHLKARFLGLAAVEKIRARQASRLTMIKAAHSNSKLFFLHLNGRRRRNFIQHFSTPTGNVFSQDEKDTHAYNHFSNLLGSPPSRANTLNWDALGLQSSNLAHLEEPFEEEEILEAVNDLHAEKAPGPDGFIRMFFRSSWGIVKEDLMLAVNYFYQLHDQHLNKLNSAHICLLPKNPDATCISDFRPISLTHSVAKIISKALANRLALCLGQLVSRSQSAFIRKRSIHDNFLFTQSLIRELHKTKTPTLFLKLDIAKAFDSVRWDYLMEVLQKLGFGNRWRAWVSNLLKVDFQPVLDKLANKLAAWKGKLLDRAGRLTLVNSVLSAIPVHFLTLFPLKKWALKKVDKIRRSFLWKGADNANGGHCLVQWTKAARPKSLGGLGILDLERFSRALRLRWLWFQWTDPHRPWVGTQPPCDKIDEALFRSSTVVSVGDGQKTNFWYDSWLSGRAPIDLAPNLYPLAWRKNKKLSEQLPNLNWTRGLWRMENAQQLNEFILLWNELEGVVLTDQADTIRWKWTENGIYSSKSAYLMQFKGSFCPFNAKSIWLAHAEGKHKFFAWLLVQAKILTADKLAQRNWPCNPVCLLCDQEPETALHLCPKCPFALQVWECLRIATSNQILPPSPDTQSIQD
ncbi:hypothetical protein U9M48_041096 [Paspalum notatum var. saurae]|uniref:Reverse transcriptase domain-containing protein n=1 Tax=Paspalum notatum var. saurae TaxID=547442 RepID=A0AAQ3UPM2_PASNO